MKLCKIMLCVMGCALSVSAQVQLGRNVQIGGAGGGSNCPAGPNGSVQYSSSGACAGSAQFVSDSQGNVQINGGTNGSGTFLLNSAFDTGSWLWWESHLTLHSHGANGGTGGIDLFVDDSHYTGSATGLVPLFINCDVARANKNCIGIEVETSIEADGGKYTGVQSSPPVYRGHTVPSSVRFRAATSGQGEATEESGYLVESQVMPTSAGYYDFLSRETDNGNVRVSLGVGTDAHSFFGGPVNVNDNTGQGGTFNALEGTVGTLAPTAAHDIIYADSTAHCLKYSANGGAFACLGSGGGSSAFNALTSGTNTAAAMLVGTGSTLGPTGTGVVTANGPPQAVLISVAASNSINKASANFIATGTNDQTTINAAINSCPATLAASAGPAQCTVVLQPGVYNVSASVVIDTDDVTLTGEGQCMSGGWNNVWTNTSSPNMAIGTGCSQLKASATGFPIVAIKHVNTPAGTGSNDTNRHRGIRISQLYLVGNSYLNQGIETVGNGGSCNISYTYGGQTITGCIDDNIEISNNIIQRTNLGIGVSLDTPHIYGNSIQDNNGPAEMVCGWFARVHDELLFDNQGTLMIACSIGGKYTNNTLGDTNGDGIHFYVNSGSATNNNFIGIVGSAMYLDNVNGVSISNNSIDYATAIDFNSGGQLPTSADAIHETAGSSGNTINGNTFQSAVNETGYAINALGTNGTVAGNTVTGTWRFGNTGPLINMDTSNQTITDSGSGNGLTYGGGSAAGIRYFSKDTGSSNLGSLVVAAGSTGGSTGILLQSKNAAYNLPTIQCGLTSTGCALDMFSFRSWQSTNTYDQMFTSANAAVSSALHRLYLTGHADNSLVQVENATFTVGGTEGSAGPVTIDTGGVETFNSTAANPLVVNSTNTGGTNVVLNNTSTGGHSFNLFSTGSASANAGAVGIYDNTASRLMFTVDGGTAQRVYTFSTGLFGWSSGNGSTGFAALDTGLSRDSAGVVDVGNGTAGNASGTLKAATGTFSSALTVAGNNVCQSTGTNCPASGTQTIASGTSALGTSAIASGACATAVTTTATGTATTDVVPWGFNADPTAVTGYSPTTNGMLTIIAYPTTNNVNFKVCNNTAASITPGAVTLNWRITR